MTCSHCSAYIGPSQRWCTGCGREIDPDGPRTHASDPSMGEAMRGSFASTTVVHEPDAILDADGHAVQPRPARAGRSRGGRHVGAGAVGLLLLLTKLKGILLALKFGKFGLTLITMVVSVAAYAAFFGLSFAVGFVLLLLVHEMGHWAVLRAKGIRASVPVFIPFLGAAIAMRGRPANVKDEAEIGIGGPIAGTAAALVVGIAGVAASGNTQSLLYALAYTGMLLNLFNLIPVSPLDGGRVAGAISRWAWPVGLALLVLLLLSHPSGILVLILLLGGFETVNRFLGRDRAVRGPGYYAIRPRERLALAIVYFGVLGVTFAGMSLFHAQLLAIHGGAI